MKEKIIYLLFVITVVDAKASMKKRQKEFIHLLEKFGPKDNIRRSEPAALRKERFLSFLKFADEVDRLNSDPNNLYTAENNFMAVLTEPEQELRLGRSSNASLFLSTRSFSKSRFYEAFPDISPDNIELIKDIPKERNWKSEL